MAGVHKHLTFLRRTRYCTNISRIKHDDLSLYDQPAELKSNIKIAIPKTITRWGC